MTCLICKTSGLKDGKTTVVFERNGSTVVVKEVPALVCPNCGEAYVDDKVSENLLRQAEVEFAKGVEVEILRYAA